MTNQKQPHVYWYKVKEFIVVANFFRTDLAHTLMWPRKKKTFMINCQHMLFKHFTYMFCTSSDFAQVAICTRNLYRLTCTSCNMCKFGPVQVATCTSFIFISSTMYFIYTLKYINSTDLIFMNNNFTVNCTS